MSNGRNSARKYAAELVGTFLFVFVGAGSALASQYLFSANIGFIGLSGTSPDPRAALLVAALANGLGLAVAISATMGISGGHLNPAVTIGLFLGRKLPGRDVLPYIVSQLVGATLAGLSLIAVFPSTLGSAVNWGAPSLNIISVAQGTTLELVMAFLLVLAVYGTIVDGRGPKIGGFGVGTIVLADVLVGGPFTGAAMNPARAMGPMIASLTFPSYWYIYWIGPVLGAALASVVYRRVLADSN